MRRLVCVVEGHGDVVAVPVVCYRVLRDLLGAGDWHVDEEPVRQPRSRLVDERGPSPRRAANRDGLARALALAHARGPHGIVIVCDADDDCPAVWGSSTPPAIERAGSTVSVRAVMASREFESWLLFAFPEQDRARVKASTPDRAPRDAKRALARLRGGYKPTLHQGELARKVDLVAAYRVSDSFAKLVRSLADLAGGEPPDRGRR